MLVLGLSGSGLFGGESPTTIANFRDQTGVTFPLLLDDTTYGDYAQPEGSISPYPNDVIVDQDGIMRYVNHQFDAEAMESTIELLLQAGN